MATLKPCPFCGNEELKIAGYRATLSAKSELYAECQKCGARGPVIESDHRKAQNENAVHNAIHWWNKRR